jgi:hypothetical protein
VALVPVPLGVVTLIAAVTAAAGTVARTDVSDSTVNVATSAPKCTDVAPANFDPVTVTAVPGTPESGVKLDTVGVTRNLAALVAVPPGVVTEIGPLVAAAGTVAVSSVYETAVNVVAATPLKRTAVAPASAPPEIVTDVPTGPEPGRNERIAGRIAKLALGADTPSSVSTVIGPLVAVAGTVARTELALTRVTEADAIPLKRTVGAPWKPVPAISTDTPAPPAVGVKLDIFGRTRNSELVAVPPAVVTVIAPVVAAAGTVAWTVVAFGTVNAAATPLNLTDVTPTNVVPLNETAVPEGPVAGAGGAVNVGVTRKFAIETDVPLSVVTVTFPVVAVAGTCVWICVAVADSIVATTPLNLSEVASPRLVPVTVTASPAAA